MQNSSGRSVRKQLQVSANGKELLQAAQLAKLRCGAEPGAPICMADYFSGKLLQAFAGVRLARVKIALRVGAIWCNVWNWPALRPA